MVSGSEVTISREAATIGILALLVDARERSIDPDKPVAKIELILDSAGLTADEISTLTGKNAGAVRKAIQRGRAK